MSDYLKANMDSLTKLILPYEPTQKQADLMLHAIGADSRKARRYKEKSFYHAYRNGFDADVEANKLKDSEMRYDIGYHDGIKFIAHKLEALMKLIGKEKKEENEERN